MDRSIGERHLTVYLWAEQVPVSTEALLCSLLQQLNCHWLPASTIEAPPDDVKPLPPTWCQLSWNLDMDPVCCPPSNSQKSLELNCLLVISRESDEKLCPACPDQHLGTLACCLGPESREYKSCSHPPDTLLCVQVE